MPFLKAQLTIVFLGFVCAPGYALALAPVQRPDHDPLPSAGPDAGSAEGSSSPGRGHSQEEDHGDVSEEKLTPPPPS